MTIRYRVEGDEGGGRREKVREEVKGKGKGGWRKMEREKGGMRVLMDRTRWVYMDSRV